MDFSSVTGFFFNAIFTLFIYIFENPFYVAIFSFTLAVIIVTNFYSARIICELGNLKRCLNRVGSGGGGVDRQSNATTMYYDYGHQHGPHTWRCSNANQSPINITEDTVNNVQIREMVHWNHYNELPASITMTNTGNTVLLKANFRSNAPTISGADLIHCYSFVEIKFRWSHIYNQGSEHMVNYHKYPLELQALHKTGTGTVTSSYDLLMLAYFFEIAAHNHYLDPVISQLHRIRLPGSSITIQPFPLCYLCYPFRTGFYSYGGSLTEPPCYEGVEWFVFPEPLTISEMQMREFRQLHGPTADQRILRNARPVQTINSERLVNFNQFCFNEANTSRRQCSSQDEDDNMQSC